MARRASSVLATAVLLIATAGAGTTVTDDRCVLWIDLYSGEPVTYGEIVDDLAGVDVVYLGERHTLARHHELQVRILEDLAGRGRVAVGLEQFARVTQETVDRFNRGEMGFEELAEAVNWSRYWPNFEQYRELLETARELGAPLVALNARVETVRAVAREGLEGLEPELRSELASDIDLDDPMYRGHLRTVMKVHAHAMANPSLVDRMFQAQVARDETMAESLVQFMQSEEGKGRRVLVIAGAGHVEHAMGVPSRVRRRAPELDDRIVVLSDSGDVELSGATAMQVNEEFEITHADLRTLSVPLADYLHVVSPREETPVEPGEHGQEEEPEGGSSE